MNNYTKEDVIAELLKLPLNSKKRILVDKRSYLVGLLAFGFKMSEHTIAKEIGIKRSKINYSKRVVLDLHTDKIYQTNVKVYLDQFPFDFSVIKSKKLSNRSTRRIILDVDERLFKKLKTLRELHKHKDIRETSMFLLEKIMKLWEE